MVEVPDLMPAHVSVENEFPEDLFKAMAVFIQKTSRMGSIPLDPSFCSSLPVSARLQGTSSSTALPEWLIPTATANKLQDLALLL